MKVYIIRHGETLYNALNQYSDEKVDLNEQGILQAQRIKRKIKRKNYNSVLIVSHSGVSKAFNGYFEGLKDVMFLHRGLKNCEIKEYEL